MVLKKIIKSLPGSKFIISLIYLIFWRLFKDRHVLVDVYAEFFYRYGRPLATALAPVLIPIAIALRVQRKYISVHNIIAVGHLYPEIDLLLRLLEKKNKQEIAKIIFITPRVDLIIESKALFERERLELKTNGLLYFIYNLTAILRPEICICVAQSNLNYVFSKRSASVRETFLVRQANRAVQLAESSSAFPLRRFGEKYDGVKLVEQLGSTRPYVVLQIKTHAVNGTMRPVDPSTLVPALNYIREQGYKIVFAGREVMPEVFKDLGIINYAQSPMANPVNDYLLVFDAVAVLSSASGFSMIPELLDKPLVSINSWQHVSYVAKKTILVPTLLHSPKGILGFEEQAHFAFSDIELTNTGLPMPHYQVTPIDGDSNDILSAITELFLRMRTSNWHYTDLQRRAKESSSNPMFRRGQSRVSHSFIEKYRHLF